MVQLKFRPLFVRCEQAKSCNALLSRSSFLITPRAVQHFKGTPLNLCVLASTQSFSVVARVTVCRDGSWAQKADAGDACAGSATATSGDGDDLCFPYSRSDHSKSNRQR